jgi:hypothetical protein
MQTGDMEPGQVPDLSPFIVLARVLKARGWFDWLPDMTANIYRTFKEGDISFYRPAQLYFVELLRIAGKHRASVASLQSVYGKFSPSRPNDSDWRQRGALEVRDFFTQRIASASRILAEQQEAARAESAKKRADDLKQAAGRRPAIEKQLFAVHWKANGLKTAEIRDKWSEANPNQLPEDLAAARKDIRIAIVRGKEFLTTNETTVEEIASLLGLQF